MITKNDGAGRCEQITRYTIQQVAPCRLFAVWDMGDQFEIGPIDAIGVATMTHVEYHHRADGSRFEIGRRDGATCVVHLELSDGVWTLCEEVSGFIGAYVTEEQARDAAKNLRTAVIDESR